MKLSGGGTHMDGLDRASPGSGIILRRLELQGFKSFADRTVLEFGPGISAIVGPNGSGKSNLSEAFRWVLGEPNARQLRGSRMEDVIFAGSAGRRPVGLAKVSITLENTGGLDLPFNEVTITRRVDRGGTSELLLNGIPCRLRDVQQLLQDTGLGREAYSVVGQGRVDQVLSSRGEDRRVLVEEAAGIIGYKERRREALRRLESVSQRLERLGDILAELRDRIAPLRLEAQRAREHRLLKEELTALELQIHRSRLADLTRQVDRVQDKVAAAQAQLAAARDELQAGEAELASARRRLDDVDDRLAALRQTLDDLTPRLEEARSGVRLAEAGLQHLDAEEDRLNREIARLTESLMELGRQAEVDHSEAELLARQVARREEELARREEAAAEADRRLAVVREEIRAAQQRLMALMEEHGRSQEEAARLAARLQELQDRRWEGEGRRAELAAAAAALTDQVAQAERELAAAQEALHQALAERDRRQRRRDEQAALLAVKEQGVLKAQEAAGALESRLAVLQDMQREYEGYGRGVRAVMAGQRQGDPAFSDVIGTVAELLTIPAEYEEALEAALGAAAQNVVTKTGRGAQRAVEELKRRNLGRATFLPLDGLAAAGPAPAHRRLGQEPGIRGWALSLVSFDPQLEPAMVHLLGRTLVAEDLAAARKAARKGDFRYRVVTLDGDLVHAGGAISGGSRSSGRQSGLLARRRLLEELSGRLAAARSELAAVQQKEEAVRAALAQMTAAVAQADEECRRLESRRLQTAGRLEELKAQQDRTQREVAALAAQQEQLAAAAAELAVQVEAARDQAGRTAREMEEVRTRLAGREKALAQAEEESRAAHAAREAGLLELERARQGLDAMLAVHRRTGDERRRMEQAVTERQQQLGELAERRRAAGEGLQAARREVAAYAQRQEALRRELEEGRREREEAAALIRSWEEAVAGLRQKVEEAREELYRHQVELERRQAQLEQAREELAQWQDLPGDWEAAGETLGEDALLTPGQLRERQRRVRELRQQLADLGEVNPLAEAQLSQLVGREAFLSHQYADLSEAAKGLRAALSMLESRMEVLFMDAFHRLRERFNAVFQELFGGGRADLALVPAAGAAKNGGDGAGAGPEAGSDDGDDADDAGTLLNAGLDIVAQPPGKRLQHLSLLSGGERALTAIALLFALLEVKPTPFCVLDEIDTALDEVNQRRFVQYLSRLSRQVQFIIITHRKITMAAADCLYGVTMGEAGVSQLVAVRMADAAAGAQ